MNSIAKNSVKNDVYYLLKKAIFLISILAMSFTVYGEPPDPCETHLVFDDMEHGDPNINGYGIFGGGGVSGSLSADTDTPPVVGGTYSILSQQSGFSGLHGFFRTFPLDLTGITHFNFWINPPAGNSYVIEVNLQEDDNSNNAFDPLDDDEFQYNLTVGLPGSGAEVISGAGWQLVSIPLTNFFDDNSFALGNGVFDPFLSDNGQLINVVFALIFSVEQSIEFTTDYWYFSCEGGSGSNPNCGSSAANAENYNAGDNIYIWSDGSNDGSGFGPWQLSTTDNDPARNGHFIGNSAANGNGDDNQDDDINKDGRSWGLYANQGNTASAIRPFTTPMVIGSSFSLKMDNGWVDENSGSKVGFSLQNSAGEDLVTFQYDGLAGHYQITNFAGTGNIDPEDIDFTDEGICIKITYAHIELYDIEIIDLASGSSYTPSREQFANTNGPQVPAQVRLFNMNAGADSPRDIFFNCLELCPPPCEITDLEVVEQDVCNPESNTFTSLVRVTYANPPSTGNLIVYGRSFPILGSPQDVVLEDLPADGGSIDVTAYFSDEPECTYTEQGVIIAPASCSDLTCESSDATGTVYDDSWQSGDNDGSGFGPWALSTSSGDPARNGFFIGNSIFNGDGDSNNDGDINTSDRTWGLYANQGNTATATRPFAQAMTEGSCLSFKMDNGFVEPGGQVTATLLAAGGSLLDILFAGDASQLQIDPSFYHIFDDNGLSNTNLEFSDEGLEIKITVRAGNTYDLEITRLEGGTATFSGRSFKSVSGSPVPIGIVFTNQSAGADPPRDLFVNSLEICHPIGGSSGHVLVLLANEDVEISAAAVVDGSIHGNDDVDVNRGAPTIIDGNISAVDDIDIKDQNTINGDVTAGDDLDNDATVNGSASGNALVDPIPLPVLAAYSAGSDDVDVEDTDDLSLPPGSYRDVVVERDGVLRFSSGEYFMDELEFGTDTRLIVDASSGPVTVNIVSDLEFGQRMVVEISGGTSNSLTFNNLQSRSIEIGREATVLGNIIAPDANVRAESYVNFRGAICARDIIFNTGAALLGHGSAQSFPKVRTNSEDGETLAALADDYELLQNYPNPFNPSTTIGFRISDAGIVTLKIYDISGRLVKTLLNESRNAGNYSVTWDGSNQSGVKVGSGIYLYKLTAGNFQQVKKMMLIK